MGVEIQCLYNHMGSAVRVDDAGVVLVVDEDNDERDHFHLSWGKLSFLQQVFFYTFGQRFSDMIYPDWNGCNECPDSGFEGPLTNNPSDRIMLEDSKIVLRDFLECEPSKFEANPQLRELFMPSSYGCEGPRPYIPDSHIYNKITPEVQRLLNFIEFALSLHVAQIAIM
jgi:hypothetical protein